MEKYFCMECKFFGYDMLGYAMCYKDEKKPRMVSPYLINTEMECFRKKGE